MGRVDVALEMEQQAARATQASAAHSAPFSISRVTATLSTSAVLFMRKHKAPLECLQGRIDE